VILRDDRHLFRPSWCPPRTVTLCAMPGFA
jgi:hypothetical protein